MDPALERRLHSRMVVPRGNVTLVARSARSQRRIPMRLLDLGPGGLRFRGHALEGRPSVGEPIVVRLVAGELDVTVSGEVVWVEDLAGGRVYVGALHFNELPPGIEDRVAQMIHLLQSPY